MQYNIFQLLCSFRSLFSRQASFVWFVVVIFGFLVRFDHYGVSSFVRWLSLPGSTYPLLLNFFHATSWSLSEVMMTWMRICQEQFSLVSLNGRLLVVGDGIKIPKEAQCQPGIKYMHGSSQNQSKPQRFSGHHFGCIAFVAECAGKFKAILQAAQIHEGVDYVQVAENEKIQAQVRETVVSRMMSLLTIIAMQQGKALYVVLDALFSTSVAFTFVFHRLQENGQPWVHLITRAKSNYVAYTAVSRRKNERIKLSSIFDNLDLFAEHPHPLHPERIVKLYYRDLYWGKTNFFCALSGLLMAQNNSF